MNRTNRVTIMGYVVAALVAGSMMSFAGNAHAALSLDYTLDSSNPSASIYFDDNCLHGSNIAVTEITGIGGTNNGNPLAITSGFLNFATGPLTSGTSGNTLTFASGGWITVTGGVPSLPTTNANTTLLYGSFGSVSVMEYPYGGPAFDIFGGTFSTTGSPSPIYSYFQNFMPSVPSSSDGINLSFLATTGSIGNNTPTSNIIASGNILDTPNCIEGAPTPIPAAAWLLGSGFMGLAGLRGRRFSKA